MSWTEIDPPLVSLLAGFLARVSKSVVLVRMDEHGRLQECNAAFQSLFPSREETLEGQPLSRFVLRQDGRPVEPDPRAFEQHPSHLKLVDPQVIGTSLHAYCFPYQGQSILIGERILPATAQALDVLSGTSNELATLTRDLKQRYQEKAMALREEEALLKMTENLATIGWWTWSLGSNRNEWSDNLFRLYGLEPGTVAPSYEAWVQVVHPEDRLRATAVVSSGVGQQAELDFEWRVNRPDGADCWLLSRAYPVLDSAGNLIRYIGTAIDITQRRQAELSLTQRTALLASVLDSTTEGIFGIDLQGRCTFCNRALLEILGYPEASALVGHNMHQVIHHSRPDGSPHPMEACRIFRALAEGKGSNSGEEVFWRADGTCIPVEYWSYPQYQEGALVGAVVTCFDITERSRIEKERAAFEAQVQHLQRMESVGRLAGGVAHDMNNVLSTIMAVGSILKERHRDRPEILKDADLLLRAAIRGRDLVRNLRDFSRKELESATELNLNELVRGEVDLLERTTLKKVAFELDLEAGLPPVFGESSALRNALMNVCMNACDALPQGGRIHLRTRRIGHGHLELSIEDNGEGMSPEVLNRALEPFFTTKALGKGTGLGLSQVYGTMKAHGGTVDIQSRPGLGTQVRLTFPSVEEDAPHAITPVPSQPLPSRSLRILLVDDEELIRTAVQRLLELLGHEVQIAAGGREALQQLQAEANPDLVVLDLSMPGMDGSETLERLRRLRPHQPVLFATGFADDRIPQILSRFPDVRVLKKPFSALELEQVLAGWL
jgi:PAS domain S-box-containing protein